MSLLHGRDIISKDKMTLLELHSAAKKGKIPVVDPEYEQITWEELIAPHKERFLKICELAEQPGKYHLKTGVKIYSKGVNSDGTTKETGNPPIRVAERPRLVRDEQKQERIPDETLLLFLQKEFNQTRITAAQFDEIQKGWGAAQEKRIVLDAVFYVEAEDDQESYIEHLEKIDIENKGIGKTVKLHRDQLPAAFKFCAGLLLENVDPKKLDKKKFTREKIVERAELAGVGQKLARDIHKNLPDILKPQQGRNLKK